jgi:hypothetical protein
MAEAFTVTAVWDPDAEVFTTKSDIPGLVVEAATFKELVDLIGSLAPEVIAANVPDAPTPYRVQIVTRRELAFARMARDFYDEVTRILRRPAGPKPPEAKAATRNGSTRTKSASSSSRARKVGTPRTKY